MTMRGRPKGGNPTPPCPRISSNRATRSLGTMGRWQAQIGFSPSLVLDPAAFEEGIRRCRINDLPATIQKIGQSNRM